MGKVEKLRETIDDCVTVDERLRAIFISQYRLGDKEQSPGYMAWGLLGMEVAMDLANMFMAVKNPSMAYRVYKTVCDLTTGLNTNDFWVKNAAVILPVVHAALNAHSDGVLLSLEKENRDEYAFHDGLRYAAAYACLDVFCTIAFCIGGPKLVALCSVDLKIALQPYFKD